MVRVRARQHVNPLSSKYSTPLAPPDWQQVYGQPNQPLHLDIGCARGRFLEKMALLHPEVNFLGVEIRQPLVEEANERRSRLGLANLHFLSGNINTSFAPLLASLPPGVLQWITVQFPDPWFKKRHLKRRMVQPELVAALVEFLVPGGKIFLQSDVAAVAEEMGDRFLSHPQLQQVRPPSGSNPFPVPTEREIATRAKGEPVYRLLLEKLHARENEEEGRYPPLLPEL